VVTPGFLEFIKFLDGILKGNGSQGGTLANINSQALRSGFMAPSKASFVISIWPAHRASAAYSEADSRVIFSTFLSACLNK